MNAKSRDNQSSSQPAKCTHHVCDRNFREGLFTRDLSQTLASVGLSIATGVSVAGSV